MPAVANPLSSSPVSRRRLLGGAVSLAAGATMQARLAGGVFTSGSERLRIGLVGCGGRGTGAAAQALAADPAVRLVAIGDLYADQVAIATAGLDRAADGRPTCPVESRFTGPDAWQRVIEADIDLVILATPPDSRPLHVQAAVAAGRHVFCETPAAIDTAGAMTIAAAAATARTRGLSLLSGLAWRHDRQTADLVGRLRDGRFGRLLGGRMTAFIGLPWHRPAAPGWSADEQRRRNWITDARQSGGDFVERQIHAIDKALWAFGDEDPLAVEPVPIAAGGRHEEVRFRFAGGHSLSIAGGRRPGAADLLTEVIQGERGACDLRGGGPRVGAGRHEAAMAHLVRTVLSGRRVDDGDILARATAAALLGRAVAATGAALPFAAAGRAATARSG